MFIISSKLPSYRKVRNALKPRFPQTLNLALPVTDATLCQVHNLEIGSTIFEYLYEYSTRQFLMLVKTRECGRREIVEQSTKVYDV